MKNQTLSRWEFRPVLLGETFWKPIVFTGEICHSIHCLMLDQVPPVLIIISNYCVVTAALIGYELADFS